MPRISALFDDLNPSTGGTVTWRQLEDRAAVTWQNVPEYYSTGSNTFQIEMYFDGIIVISYLSISASDGMAGLSEGLGVPTGFLDTDLSGMGDCMIDCNDNGVPDDEDISNGTSNDCNENSIPDECDIADGTSKDCNSNEAPDECDIADGTSEDCNINGIPDECDIADGTSLDCNENGRPDECDLADGTSQDCNGNEAPDECDIADGTSFDDNGNGVPDECELVLRPDPVGFDPDMWDNPPGDTSCMQDSDCHTAASTTPYCIPKQDGGFPGTCYASTNRYLSIRKNPDQTSASGRRISLSTGEAGPWWVGPPIYNPGLDMYFSSVVNVPAFAGMGAGAWVNGDWPDELHVKGCEIAPGTHSYWVQAVAFGDEGDEGLYSVVLDLRIQERWGDVISTCFFDQCLPPQGAVTQPDIDDVLAMVNAFQGVPNAPLWWMDIDPFFADGEPEGLPALIGDVLAVVNAFVGLPYTGNGPAGCAP
jgi:hypothetical protein